MTVTAPLVSASASASSPAKPVSSVIQDSTTPNLAGNSFLTTDFPSSDEEDGDFVTSDSDSDSGDEHDDQVEMDQDELDDFTAMKLDAAKHGKNVAPLADSGAAVQPVGQELKELLEQEYPSDEEDDEDFDANAEEQEEDVDDEDGSDDEEVEEDGDLRDELQALRADAKAPNWRHIDEPVAMEVSQ
ncbi:hypothetical protein HKX48_007593 [Thoreauomyces humboldtii]|nr:hypothetical protein HKX48_007593 [Thoreauomyces humboldtii]